MPSSSIMLLDGRDAAPQALAAFRESLAPGGRLILDVEAPQPVTGPAPMRYWRRDPYLWTLQTMHTEPGPGVNQTTSFLRYEKWHDGRDGQEPGPDSQVWTFHAARPRE